jgi:hypothetical protein
MRYRLKGHESEVSELYRRGMSTVEIAKQFGVSHPSVRNCLIKAGVSRRTGSDAHPLKEFCKYGHDMSGDNLYLSPRGVRGCRVCRTKYLKENPPSPEKASVAHRRHAEKNPDYHKDDWRKRKYGLSPEAYAAKLESQEHRCKICGRVMSKPNVDHDHETNEVRDLLCWPCNCGIGFLQDSPVIAQAAADYLKRWKG